MLTHENALMNWARWRFLIAGLAIIHSVVVSAPLIVNLDYPGYDVPVILYNVSQSPYSADISGNLDATQAIQKALNDCGSLGGGVVFLPTGKYRIDAALTIPEAVTLRGDWKLPTPTDSSAKGTTLLIYHGKGNINGAATITLGNGSAVKGLNIFYPEQSATSPIPYPFTILGGGSTQTVLNVTFVNAYQAIAFTSASISVTHPLVKNVFGAPLFCGILLNNAHAIPRLEGVHFHPSFWSKSGLPGSPSASVVKNALRSLSSKGIQVGESDNFIMGDIDLDGYDVGIDFSDPNQGSSNGKAYDFTITRTRIGINIASQKVQGWGFTHGSIASDDPKGMCLNIKSSEPVGFNDVDFTSNNIIVNLEDGSLSLTRCHFKSWGDTSAIIGIIGNVLISGNTFGAATPRGSHFDLRGGLTGITLFGNTYVGTPKIINNSKVKAPVIDTTAPNTFTDVGLQKYVFAPRPLPAKTSPTSLYNVIDYGAMGNGIFDNTLAFQQALDLAGTVGGGTVFVPAGIYRINGNLNVPQGVELRGVNDAPFYSNFAGSILLTYAGKNNSSATPFITLQAKSGLSGFLIYRPEQPYNENTNQTEIFPYPPAIYANGSGCWAINLVLPNTYIGIDFSKPGTGGHYIDFYFAASIHKCLLLRADGAPSTVENMQTNPNFFRGVNQDNWTAYMPLTLWNAFKSAAPLVKESQNLWPLGTAVEVHGDGEFRFYANFYNSPFKGFVINGGPKMTTFLSGGEGDKFYEVSKTTGTLDLTIIANSYHPIEAGGNYGQFNLSSVDDRVRIINTTSFGGPDIAYSITNGSLLIQQAYQVTAISSFVKASGTANVNLEGAYLRSGSASVLNAESNAKGTIIGCLSSKVFTTSGAVTVTGSSVVGAKITAIPKQDFNFIKTPPIRFHLGTRAIKMHWNGSFPVTVAILQINGKIIDRVHLAPHSAKTWNIPYDGLFLIHDPLTQTFTKIAGTH